MKPVRVCVAGRCDNCAFMRRYWCLVNGTSDTFLPTNQKAATTFLTATCEYRTARKRRLRYETTLVLHESLQIQVGFLVPDPILALEAVRLHLLTSKRFRHSHSTLLSNKQAQTGRAHV